MRYVDSLLYHQLSYVNISTTAASQWIMLKNITQVAYVMCVSPYRRFPTELVADRINENYTHSSPCGRLRFPSITHCVDCGQTYHETILMYESFRLNITFVEFYMTNDCQYNSLTLVPTREINRIYAEPICGWRQSWSLFYNENPVYLLYKSLTQNPSNYVSILYDVYEDRDIQPARDREHLIMYNYNITKEINTYWITPFIIRKTIFWTLYIRSNINHQILTRMPLRHGKIRLQPYIRLYEGPNTRGRYLSHTVHKGIMWGRTTGFQLVVSVMAEDKNIWFAVRYKAVWTSLKPNVLNVSGEETHVTLPSSSCQVTWSSLVLCYHNLAAHGVNNESKQRGFIKVNILNSTLDGPNTDDCRLSGLVMVSTSDTVTVTRLQDTYTMSQWPVVVVCRNTMVWNQGTKTLPFKTFTSHTADVALVVYTYIPHIGHINITVSVQLTMCQGFHINCEWLPQLYVYRHINPVTNLLTEPKTQILHQLNNKLQSMTDYRISLLERLDEAIGNECKDFVGVCAEPDMLFYVKDSAAVWCSVASVRKGLRCMHDEQSHMMHNFNMYPEVECLTIQSLPYVASKRRQNQVDQCRITLHDPQSRLQDGSINIDNNFRNTEVCLGLRLFQMSTEDLVVWHWAQRSSSYDYQYWATNNYFMQCGYFTMSIRASAGTVISEPQPDHTKWHTVPQFRVPIVGSDLDIPYAHTLRLTPNFNNNLLIAHTDYYEYEHLTLRFQFEFLYKFRKIPLRHVDRLQPYKTMYYLTLESAEQTIKCSQINITMKIIQQTTQPLFGHLHHYITLNLSIGVNSGFSYHELLLTNRRFIILQTFPIDNPCEAVVMLNIDPKVPISSSSHFGLSQRVIYSHRLKSTDILTDFGTFDYILVWDTASPVSWMEASDICKELGAQLPVVTTEQTQEMMEKLMLGNTFRANGSEFLRSPCRHDSGPFCMAFIGLHFKSNKVGVHFIHVGLHFKSNKVRVQ